MRSSFALTAATIAISTTHLSSFGQAIDSTPPILLPTSPTRIQSTFGNRLHIHGSWMAIGADHDVPDFIDVGEVYLYKRSDTGWEYRQRLLAPDGFPGNHFGLPVLLGEEVLMIGAPTDDDLGFWSGSVYCYKLVGEVWVFDAKIKPPLDTNVFSLFGLTLSFGVNENELVVGSYLESTDNSTSGAVYFFKRTLNTWQMIQRLNYPNSPGAAYFGRSVDVHNRKLAVGVPGLRTSELVHPHGAVVLYDRISDMWIPTQTIMPTEPQDFQLFGEWVDLHINSLAVSSPGEHVEEFKDGALYIYDIVNDVAVLNTKFIAPISYTSSFSFPSTFSNDGNLLYVGAHSSSYEAEDAGTAWILQKLDGTEWGNPVQLNASHNLQGDSFGRSMAFDNMTAYVSGPRVDLAGVDAGAVFKFELQDCNFSGVLDAWEISTGELADGNNDGIPDICQETSCDLNGDGLINGSDLGMFYGYWGTDGSLGGDFDASGLVDSADLAIILIKWTG